MPTPRSDRRRPRSCRDWSRRSAALLPHHCPATHSRACPLGIHQRSPSKSHRHARCVGYATVIYEMQTAVRLSSASLTSFDRRRRERRRPGLGRYVRRAVASNSDHRSVRALLRRRRLRRRCWDRIVVNGRRRIDDRGEQCSEREPGIAVSVIRIRAISRAVVEAVPIGAIIAAPAAIPASAIPASAAVPMLCTCYALRGQQQCGDN